MQARANVQLTSSVFSFFSRTDLTIAQTPLLHTMSAERPDNFESAVGETYKAPIPIKTQIPILTLILIWIFHMKAIGSVASAQSQKIDEALPHISTTHRPSSKSKNEKLTAIEIPNSKSYLRPPASARLRRFPHLSNGLTLQKHRYPRSKACHSNEGDNGIEAPSPQSFGAEYA